MSHFRGGRRVVVRCQAVTLAILLLLVLLLLTGTTDAASSCTLCADGGAFDASSRIGTVRCQEVQTYLSATDSNSQVCYDAQLQGYLYCACATYPTNVFCAMCDNGSTEVSNPDAVIDTLNPPKACRDALFASQSNKNDCLALVEAATSVCGCPAASPPQCSLCQLGDVQYPTRIIPSDLVEGGPTCEQLESLASNASDTDCATFASDLTSSMDVPAYCGCSDAPTQGTLCGNLCPDGQNLVNSETTVTVLEQSMTCQQASDLTPFVIATADDWCEALRGVAPTCCGEAPAPTAPSAPSAPSSPTSTNPPASAQPTSASLVVGRRTSVAAVLLVLVLSVSTMGW